MDIDVKTCGDSNSSEVPMDWLTILSRYPPILELLMDYLKFDDIKNLRSTNLEICQNISRSGRIEKTGTLHLLHPKLIYDHPALCRLHRNKWNFKNVQLDLLEAAPLQPFRDMYLDHGKCFKKRKSYFQNLCENHLINLELRGFGKHFKTFHDKNWPGPRNGNITSPAYKHLSSLEIRDNTLNGIATEDFKPLTVNLKSIKILMSKYYIENDFLLDNMKFIAENCKNLTEYVWNGTIVLHLPLLRQLKSCYAQAIQANTKTITTLVLLHEEVIRQLENSVLPNLKRVIVLLMWNDGIEQFLTKQPFLEFFSYTHSRNVAPAMDFILKRGQALKTLIFRGAGPPAVSEVVFEIPWSAFQNLKSLTTFEFSVQDNQMCIYYAFNIFPNLSPSLKYLRLRNVINTPHPSDASTRISSYSKLPFENITSLLLERCKNILSDQDLQNIFCRFTKLQKLRFDQCDITDFGLTGIHDNETDEPNSGISIKNLKCLVDLRMNTCPNVTNNIGNFLSFEHLEILELLKNPKMDMNEDFNGEIWKQNPKLQVFNHKRTSRFLNKTTREYLSSSYQPNRVNFVPTMRTL